MDGVVHGKHRQTTCIRRHVGFLAYATVSSRAPATLDPRYDQDKRDFREPHVKKGRHRRFEEARALKRIQTDYGIAPCEECGAGSEDKCASWCLARVLDEEEDTSEEDAVFETEKAAG
jgi:hypothetical protein